MSARLLGLFLALLAACSQAAGQPVERFFQRPGVLEAKLSPTGRHVAVSTSRGADRIGLAVYEFAAGKALRVAQYVDADVVRFDWAGTERLVYSVRDLQTGGMPSVFAVNADGKELRQLIRRPGANAATNMALDWNHSLLHVPMQQAGVRPGEVIIGQFNGALDGTLASITPMWLDTVTGRSRLLEVPGQGRPEGVVQWMFDGGGQPRVAISRSQGRMSAHALAPGESQWRRISEGSFAGLQFTPRAVDDDGTLYVTRADGPGGHSVLARFDFETMKPEAQALVSVPGFDFQGELVLDRAGARALGVRVNGDAEQTVWWDPAMKAFQARVDAAFPERVNRIRCVRCGQADMTALVFSYTDRDPGTLLAYEAAANRWNRIGEVMDGIAPARMASVEFHAIKARDGRELPVWLTVPASAQPGQALPTVVLVHGGPWLRGGAWRWQPMEQFLASRGYLVVSPEFRGSTGYGFAHYQAGWKQWGQAMQDDVADALLWAQQQGLAEKGRACIAGASYGGYATLMGLARHPELYRCGVAWVAVTDLPLLVEGSWWVDDDTSSDIRRYSLPETIGDAEKDKAMLRAHSPVHQAARITAPLLLAFGEADRRVPLAHGKRLREALTDAGHPPEWVSYAREGHSWHSAETHIDWARRVEKFLAEQLKKKD